jgi:hypothetical protein
MCTAPAACSAATARQPIGPRAGHQDVSATHVAGAAHGVQRDGQWFGQDGQPRLQAVREGVDLLGPVSSPANPPWTCGMRAALPR